MIQFVCLYEMSELLPRRDCLFDLATCNDAVVAHRYLLGTYEYLQLVNNLIFFCRTVAESKLFGLCTTKK